MTEADRRRAALAHLGLIVRRSREEAGYPGAGAFFKSAGGRAFFGCAPKAYQSLERGAALPQPALVERVLAALRLPLSGERAREFALAYLRALFGWEPAVDLALEALASPEALRRQPPPELALAAKARLLLQRSEEARVCLAALLHAPARRSAAELAERFGLTEAGAARALDALRRAGLLRSASGRYWSPEAGSAALPAELSPRSWREAGEIVFEHPLLLRASESELKHYLPYLAQSARSSRLRAAAPEEGERSLWVVSMRVERLVAF